MGSYWEQSPVIKMVVQPSQQSDNGYVSHWRPEEEGQLAVDVMEVGQDVVILSTLAGADIDSLEISLHNDLLTIRGNRPEPQVELNGEIRFFHKECFWGRFSRTVVLPVDVKSDMARAEYKNGVLTITIPKQHLNTKIPVVIVDE